MKLSVRAISESAFAIAIFIAILFVDIYIPVLGTFATLLIGVPFFINSYRNGIAVSSISMIAGIFLAFIFFEPFMVLTKALTIIPPAIVMGLLYRKNYQAGTIMPIATFLSVAMMSVMLFIFSKLTDIDIISIFTEQLKLIREASNDTNFNRIIDLYISYISNLLPAMIIIYSLITNIFTYYLSVKIYSRMDSEIRKLGSFDTIILPREVAFATTFFILGFMIMDYFTGRNVFMFNFTPVFAFIYLLPSLSLVYYFLSRRMNKSLASILTLMIYFTLSSVIPYIGLFDTISDFRKLRSNNDKSI